MDKSIKFTARLGNHWKISRTIRDMKDANKAIRDFREKLKRQTPVMGDQITYKLDHTERRCGIWSRKAIELAMLEVPLLIETHMLTLKMLPYGVGLSAVHEDMKLIECNVGQEEQERLAIDEAANLASELWADADELLTVCHLFQQTVLRCREWWEENEAVAVALEPILDTHELLDRRIRHIRDNGKAITKMLEAA